jgi:hypothetical protein
LIGQNDSRHSYIVCEDEIVKGFEEEIKRYFILRSAKAISRGKVLASISDANYDKQREAEAISLKGTIN